MKKTFIVFIFFLGVFVSNAQITLNQGNVPFSTTYTDYRIYNDFGVAIPIEGTNQVYDYSGLPAPTGSNSFDYFPATRSGFTGFDRYVVTTSNLGGFNLVSEYYSEVNVTGLYDVASYKLPQSFGLGGQTGNSSDSLIFPGNENFFSSPSAALPFPNTMGTSSTSILDFAVEFELTIAAYGMNNTPGVDEQVVERSVETVGYGQLVLPINGGQTIPYDVLMVKDQKRIIDSFFVAGSPAPSSLLSAFNLVQGDTTYENHYKFFAEGFELPIFSVKMNDDWTSVLFSCYDNTNLQEDNGSGLQGNGSLNDLSIYPNPTSSQVTISAEGIIGTPVITLTTISGKIVKTIKPDASELEGKGFSIELSELPNGAYFMNIATDTDTVTRKIVIAN